MLIGDTHETPTIWILKYVRINVRLLRRISGLAVLCNVSSSSWVGQEEADIRQCLCIDEAMSVEFDVVLLNAP